MSQIVCSSPSNLEFLKKADKIYFVAMHEEFDASCTSSPVVFMGVGKARATRALLGYIKEHPDMVHSGKAPLIVSLGTAGSGLHHRGDIILCDSFVNNGDDFILERKDFDTFPVREGAVCASSDFFISEKIFPKAKVEEMRCLYDCMDMESFALANICSVFGLRFCAVKCVSDGCDGSVADFDAQLPVFREKLCRFARGLDGTGE